MTQLATAGRRELEALAVVDGAYSVDCSRVYGEELLTAFTDVWHFSDVGHQRVAETLAQELEPVVRAAMEHGG
jgi:hypothetical protein